MSDRVLVDTNAWITFFTPGFRDLPEVAGEVEALLETGRACYTEMIMMELLMGIRSNAEAERFRHAFTGLTLLSLCDSCAWTLAYGNASELRRGGIRSEPVDVIIASVAIHYDVPLFHHDRHFIEMKKVLPLRENSFL